MKCYCTAAALSLAAAIGVGQSAPVSLPASPATVVWGYYSAHAKAGAHRPLRRHGAHSDAFYLRPDRAHDCRGSCAGRHSRL